MTGQYRVTTARKLMLIMRATTQDLYTIGELSSMFKCSTKTIRRYFEALQDLGFPLDRFGFNGNAEVRWSMDVERIKQWFGEE